LTDTPHAAHQFTATTNAAVAQARLVARDAVAKIDAGTYGFEAWGRSLLTFFDIVARGSATHFKTASTAEVCCGPSSPQEAAACGMGPSDPIFVPADHDYSRQLSIIASFQRVGTQVKIPDNLIRFQPPVLAAGATSFVVYVQDAQYIGRSYTGTVRLTRVPNSLAPTGYVDCVVTVEL
jgi:hypothetical protein